MSEAIAVNIVCIAVVAANGLFVLYRWTPVLLSPYLQLACVGTLLFASGNLAANLTTHSPELYWVSLCFLYTGLFMAVVCWWLVSAMIIQHQGYKMRSPRRVWRDLPLAAIALVWLGAISNPWHNLFVIPIPGGRSEYGPLWYVGALVCWLIIISTTLFCIIRMVKVTYTDDRWQLALCAVSMLTPTLLNLTYTMASTPPLYDPTIIGFAISTSLLVIAVYWGQVYGATGVRLEDAIENDSRPGLLLDRNQRLIHANEAAKSLFDTPEIRLPVLPLLSGKLLNRDGSPADPQEILRDEALFRLAADPDRWLSIEHRPVRLASRDVGAAWFVRDETARVRVDEALQAARKFESLGLIAGGIAHDFNNLLVSVIGNAELAELQLDHNREQSRQLLENITTAGRQGADLAKQLLAYAGKASIELGDVNLNHAAEKISKMLRNSMRSEVSLDLDLADPAPVALADSSQVTQVLLNLLINAEEALPESGGNITVNTHIQVMDQASLSQQRFAETAQPGEFAVVSVCDNGPGIDESTLSRMFDPFFSTKSAGRGLGLAASLGTVRSHRGVLTVDTQAGFGTTISMCLPISTNAIQPKDVQPSPNQHWEGMTALLIDDNSAVRRVHTLMLRELGFQVVEASDGPTGIPLAEDADLVVTDITMPGMSGESVAQVLGHQQPNLPVVLVSGYSEAYVGSGDRHFLKKPFSKRELATVINTAIKSAARS